MAVSRLKRLNSDLEKLIPLTQAEVNALPNGAKVLILWSGGNGPHKYTLQRFAGKLYTCDEVTGRPQHCVDFVGLEKPFTRVWLIVEKEV